jgi:glutamate synthase domain-containing protein 2/glutamate synthase domain-containing protein 1/glutamate synthase domain-containing protein 3
MEHRGAEGWDASTGDGAGMLTQIPDELLRDVSGIDLPPPGCYGVGVLFLPTDNRRRSELEALITDTAAREGQTVIGFRDVPVQTDQIGSVAAECAPFIRQVFIGASQELRQDEQAFERKLYVIRRLAEKAAGGDLYVASLSSKTVVYKGMLSAPQLPRYYSDLRDSRYATALALVHSRFSTNTFPTWPLAHPYRLIAHNGEFNTLMGNKNWIRARESQLSSDRFGEDLKKLLPVVTPGGSDSASFDEVLELLVLAGRSLPHALMMMIPEAHERRGDIPPKLREFYDYHSCVMEPWDGPASVSFTDGRILGATLDRNGLRPGRWCVTKDGWVVLSSEAGALPLPQDEIERKGRLKPGSLFVVDTNAHTVKANREAELEVAGHRPYGDWYRDSVVHINELAKPEPRTHEDQPLHLRQLAFGYSREDLNVLLQPMATKAKEPDGSMGNDASLAVLSERQPPLFSYFKQLFAQVTNPAIDPVREDIVMSLGTRVGPLENLLDETAEHAHQLVMDHPVLRSHELERLRQVSHQVFKAATLDTTWPIAEEAGGMEAALDRLCRQASEKIAQESNVLILSDRRIGPDRAAIPSLLAVAAVHHHLVREGTRLRTGLVCEAGDAREVHHIACLIGYGASAVNPYLMFESLGELRARGELPDELSQDQAEDNTVKALGKGLLKIISKMGISTIQSYCGAQIFESVGLNQEVVERFFTGTPSRIGGVGLDVLAREALERHKRAYPTPHTDLLPVGGVYAWRHNGEHHMWNPETITLLQRAVHAENGQGWQAYEDYSRTINDDAARRATLRGLLNFRPADKPLQLDEVEPASEIVKRFSTGGMSLGSLSPEAHETLAIAMNRIQAKSNTGEGGEDRRRYTPDKNGDSRRSAIKQVASARFGVTIDYLTNADELQIKISQGSKPGEGGQLPGHKVDDYIAKLRFATPGVELISPPPHHDIYSIEDLKQLIYDLRCANPWARISVKLAAEVGVGTVAAGVAKANSDHVVIAGFEGGTGSSPLSSIQGAGVPWELGLAETHQTLVRNNLRSRIAVEVDGQMKTGRDVVVAGLLGAEEMGFSTAPLIATGCIMMRVCHLNTCPVGIATQDPELRKRFQGTPDHVISFFFGVAEETRRIMAQLGIASFDDLIGRTDLLEPDQAINHWKAQGVDLTGILSFDSQTDSPRYKVREQEPVLEDALDFDLIASATPALERGEKVQLELGISNVNRTVGGLLSNAVTRAHGPGGLDPQTIEVTFHGSAGQSFGAWLAPGVEFTLFGEANDYAGKGLSGGVVCVRPAPDSSFCAEDNVIVGNTVLYGATAGRAFFSGLAGERFGVRNSGAWAVVEGVGDHGCEYMTGGRVVVLGETGYNFAAGMSGGIAYVLDANGRFAGRCNTELVDTEALTESDLTELRGLVEEHSHRTGSAVADRVLVNFEDYAPRFVKVMPRSFRAALEAQGYGDSREIERPQQSVGEVGAV